jgi:hypothetical protein
MVLVAEIEQKRRKKIGGDQQAAICEDWAIRTVEIGRVAPHEVVGVSLEETYPAWKRRNSD